MNAIKEWIEKSGSYEDGCELYEQYGKNSYLKKFFRNYPGPESKKMLIDELSKLIDQVPVKVKGHFQVHGIHSFYELSKDVQKLITEKTKLYNRAINLKSLLAEYEPTGRVGFGNEIEVVWKNFKSSKEASDAVREFETINHQLREIWAKLDYFDLHKKLPEPVVIPKKELTTAKEISTRIGTLRSNISKFKNDPRMDLWVSERDFLIEKLNNVSISQ